MIEAIISHGAADFAIACAILIASGVAAFFLLRGV